MNIKGSARLYIMMVCIYLSNLFSIKRLVNPMKYAGRSQSYHALSCNGKLKNCKGFCSKTKSEIGARNAPSDASKLSAKREVRH